MSKSERVEAIFERFYKGEAIKKSNSLHSHVLNYLKAIPDLEMFEASLDEFRVKRLTDAYFIDVIRYKEYHISPKPVEGEIKHGPMTEPWTVALHNQETGARINDAKIAALTVKWLLRYQPISLKGALPFEEIPEATLRKAEFINESFAVAHAMSLLKVAGLNEKTVADLLYHFKYRPYDERHFFLVFDVLSRVGK
jgi:hypothetical protein